MGCGVEVEWLILVSLSFIHGGCQKFGWESGSAFLPPSMEGDLGTFGGPEKRVVEVPLQPLAWVGLVAIYCRHLLTRQRISLATVELVRGVS